MALLQKCREWCDNLTAANHICPGCRVLLLLWIIWNFDADEGLSQKYVMLDKRHDTVRWKIWNWGHWLLDGHNDRLFLEGRCYCKTGCFYWVQGSAIQPADSCVVKWGNSKSKHNPQTSWCSLCLRPLSQVGGGFTERRNRCMLLSSAVYKTKTTRKTYLQLFSRVVSCFMVCPFGANKNMQSTRLCK